MRDLSSVIKTVAILAAAAGTAAYVYFSTRSDLEVIYPFLNYLQEEEEQKQDESAEMVEEKEPSDSTAAASTKLDESTMIDMINEVSDTMLLVFVGFYIFCLFIFSYLATTRNGGCEYGQRWKA